MRLIGLTSIIIGIFLFVGSTEAASFRDVFGLGARRFRLVKKEAPGFYTTRFGKRMVMPAEEDNDQWKGADHNEDKNNNGEAVLVSNHDLDFDGISNMGSLGMAKLLCWPSVHARFFVCSL